MPGSPDVDPARLEALRGRLPSPFALCGFLGQSEREWCAWRLIHLAAAAVSAGGSPAVPCLPEAPARARRDVLPDDMALAYLVDVGYAARLECEPGGEPRVAPTPRLLSALESFLD